MALKLWGQLSPIGAAIAALTFALDQASKWLVLVGFNLDERPPITVTSFFDLMMAWNEGVSYSLFSTQRQWMLVALSLVLVMVLARWLAKAEHPVAAYAVGLVIGGALGNAFDRILHGAVADFMHFHWGNWSWYIFNVADIAIVVGVLLLIYDSFKVERAKSTVS